MQHPFSSFRNTEMCIQCSKIRKRRHLPVPALACRTRRKGFPLALSTAIATHSVTAANLSNRDCAKPRQRAKQHVLCVRARTSRNEHVLARVRNVRKQDCSEPSVHAGKLEPNTLVEFRCVQFNKILNRVLDNFERASNQRHAGQGSRSGKIRRTVRFPPFGPSRVRHYFSDSFRRSHTANHPVNL